MIDSLLLLDTETTGLDETAVCIEVAAGLYSVPYEATVQSFSALCRAPSNPAEKINRIPEALVQTAPPGEIAWARVAELAADVDAVIAHGVDFDRRFVPPGHVLLSKPWICSLEDLAWPRSEKSGESLVKLALAHDLGVSHAHRAAVDVDLLARLFMCVVEMGTDLQAFLAYGLRPKARYQALVPFERKDEAKELGFAWEPETKRWLKTMATEDTETLPFPVRWVAAVNRGPIDRARFAAIDLGETPPVERLAFVSKHNDSPIEKVKPC